MPFQPSLAWQAVPDGTVLPPGLQIEVDVTTGKKRAKIPWPEALTELALIPQWTAWQKGTKLPLNPKTLKAYGKGGDGILPHLTVLASVKGLLVGFYAVADDPFVLLDLDHVRDPETGKILDWASALVRLLDSYTEVSPSGTGLHIIIRCRDKPRDGYVVQKHGGAKIEVRVNTQYITITGDVIHHGAERLKEHPREILDHPLFLPANAHGNGADAKPKGNGTARDQGALDIVVSAERGLSGRDLLLLEENHPDLWRVWVKKATPTRDATHSGYMASIARRLVNMGRDDQWIADALVEFCHRHKRFDCIEQRQMERCIILARSEPNKADEKPESLQAAVEALAEDDALEGVEDKRAEQLRILSQHFKMEISDVRKFGRNPGRVQFRNCEDWIDIGTPAQILLGQGHVLAQLYGYNGNGVETVKPVRWVRLTTIIGRCWRQEDPGDEEVTNALEEMIDAAVNMPGSDGHPTTTESMMMLRASRKCHEWQGKRYVFAPSLKADAKMNGIAHLHQALRVLGYDPEVVAAAGKTTRNAWVKAT